MDILLLLLLILLNGVLAMSEIAVVSSRKSRLQKLADDGSPGAKSALDLSNEPSGFLSTVQVGITTVGILSGAIGENAHADPLTHWLSGYSVLEPYARGVSLTLVVVGLTYFSVVVGELVPKRLGLLAPESIAALIATPMNVLARVTRPLVWLLSVTMTAGVQKIWHPDRRIGFLAQADHLAGQLASGLIGEGKLAETQILIFNNRLDAAVTALFMVLVSVVVLDAARVWRRTLRT